MMWRVSGSLTDKPTENYYFALLRCKDGSIIRPAASVLHKMHGALAAQRHVAQSE